MPAVSFTKLGHYEILATLGHGGMGDVYKARDTRLGRLVALKIPKTGFSARAEREARAVSTLNHPNICQLYDVGNSASHGNYLVMEFVDGETLQRRIQKGPLQLQEAITIASQIAGALAAAHRSGIVHRDLKPANIMLTRAGVKLLDFGLAWIDTKYELDETKLAADVTEPGTILGTFQYMAPEQVKGLPADARTDLFAFGLVLYEMLTGIPAFQSENRATLISAILSSEPAPLASLRSGLPRALVGVVNACLRKGPEERWQSAHDLQLELELLSEEDQPAPSAGRSSWPKIALSLIAASLLAGVMFLAATYLRRPEEVHPVRSSLLPPPNWSFERGGFALSPDGSRLAFVAFGPDGSDRLWVRSMAASSAQQLAGTENAWLPFWSPDNRHIGFFAQGKLKTIDIDNTAVRILCQAPLGRCGGAWSRTGSIVFAPSIGGPLYRVQDSGGAPVPVTTMVGPSTGQRHQWPCFLPDGKHFLYSVVDSLKATRGGLYVGSLDGGPAKLISGELDGNIVFASGHLIYGLENSLRTRPFDPKKFQLTGTETSLGEQELAVDSSFSYSQFSVSQNGTLVFQSLADSASRLSWFDSTGKQLSQLDDVGYRDPRLSPDGRRLAVASDDNHDGKFVIRVYNFARGLSTRISAGPLDMMPAWSPNGDRVIYAASAQSYSLKEIAPDGSGVPRNVIESTASFAQPDWSPQGLLTFADFAHGVPRAMLYEAAKHAERVLSEPGVESRFSPDGKWVAYSGSDGIVVESASDNGTRIAISGGHASEPVWSHDGKSIFYIASDRSLMMVPFKPDQKTAGAPRVVFKTRIIATGFFGTQYDVSNDGKFLINSLPANNSSPLTLISGWVAQSPK